MELEALQQIANITGSLSTTALLLYLLLAERREHKETREKYREDLRQMAFTRIQTPPE